MGVTVDRGQWTLTYLGSRPAVGELLQSAMEVVISAVVHPFVHPAANSGVGGPSIAHWGSEVIGVLMQADRESSLLQKILVCHVGELPE